MAEELDNIAGMGLPPIQNPYLPLASGNQMGQKTSWVRRLTMRKSAADPEQLGFNAAMPSSFVDDSQPNGGGGGPEAPVITMSEKERKKMEKELKKAEKANAAATAAAANGGTEKKARLDLAGCDTVARFAPAGPSPAGTREWRTADGKV